MISSPGSRQGCALMGTVFCLTLKHGLSCLSFSFLGCYSAKCCLYIHPLSWVGFANCEEFPGPQLQLAVRFKVPTLRYTCSNSSGNSVCSTYIHLLLSLPCCSSPHSASRLSPLHSQCRHSSPAQGNDVHPYSPFLDFSAGLNSFFLPNSL